MEHTESRFRAFLNRKVNRRSIISESMGAGLRLAIVLAASETVLTSTRSYLLDADAKSLDVLARGQNPRTASERNWLDGIRARREKLKSQSNQEAGRAFQSLILCTILTMAEYLRRRKSISVMVKQAPVEQQVQDHLDDLSKNTQFEDAHTDDIRKQIPPYNHIVSYGPADLSALANNRITPQDMAHFQLKMQKEI